MKTIRKARAVTYALIGSKWTREVTPTHPAAAGPARTRHFLIRLSLIDSVLHTRALAIAKEI